MPVGETEDEAPSIEQIGKIYEPTPVCLKFIISLFTSGIPVGCADGLLVGDLSWTKPSRSESLNVYRGSVECYYRLLTPESVDNLRAYLAERERREDHAELS